MITFYHVQVCVEGLSTKQAEIELEVRGPPVSKAFDQQGNPTKVLFVLSSGLLCSPLGSFHKFITW